ncbi:hypothetical protein BD309DRAFT_968169 [Dichomitus squalens]|uniref:Uncharacterized protein n=1 Tax=Dichomitus squalens TaxID=114155 RepID=A0A4Q9NKE7_9APHY|nr:hypothetical protein BD309DRAFT_968169 [Dichomitus squalens]TBU63913.1 hypothetical protein BD310DRAFT_839948 [Dichomitus squalens]
MASSTRFATPPINIQAREPVTPDTGVRSRSTTRAENGNGSPDVNASPTSSTVSSLSRILEPSRSLYRPITSQPPSALGTPARKVTIRADPALLTCFDPADGELYNLWAPKV